MPFKKSKVVRSNYTGTAVQTFNDCKESLTAVSPNFYFGAGDPVTLNTAGALTHAITAVATTVATTTQIVGVAMRQHSLGTWAAGTTTATYTSTAANIPVSLTDLNAGWWVCAGNSTATGNSSTTTASSFVVGNSYLLAYDQIGASGPYATFINAGGSVAATSAATSSCLTVLALDTKNNMVLVRPSAAIRHPLAK